MRDYSPLRGLAAASPTVHLKSATVVELLDELDRLRAAGVAPVKLKRNDYPADFEAVWEVYPERPGASKAAAHKAWAARIKLGATVAEMLAGVQAYAAYVKAIRPEPQFIKQAATFFGPGEHYAADWTVPEVTKKATGGAGWWLSDEAMAAKGREFGLKSNPGESRANFEARIRAAIDNDGAPPAATPIRVTPPITPQAPSAAAEPRSRKPEGLVLKDLVRRDPPARAA